MGESHWMNTVVFFKNTEQFTQATEHIDFNDFSDKSVPIKMHMGEVKNKYFTPPQFVKIIVNYLINKGATPFLTDTTVAYNAPRKSVSGYKKVAYMHGFSKKKLGCEIIIDDTGFPITIENTIYQVAMHLYNASHIIAVSHVKGHPACGMGGAIKNLGMGGVTKETKQSIHQGARPVYHKQSCTYCGVCAQVCPFNALTVKPDTWEKNQKKCFGCGVCVDACPEQSLSFEQAHFQYALACACKACVQDKTVVYVNDVNRIARTCDCNPFAGPTIAPDIGYLLGTDPVAVDAASLMLIDEVKADVFRKTHHVDPWKQIHFGEQIGLGSSKYNLVEL